jgi:tetratricopeptide (TPR) repeat protein
LKSIYTYLVSCLFVLILLTGCKTNKNTFIHRGYHNLTARFNGYYYATESIKEGEEKIRTSYKYDYDRLLPVFLVPTNETTKATFPEFDKAIKKSSNCIQRHTIKDKKGVEITTAGRWIDNNWNVIGISHFYKREFFSGIEAFEYVLRSYKSKDRYKALIWLARSQNEIGAPSQAEPIISLLKEDKKISKYAKKELPAVQADYYIKRGMYKEAEDALISALKGGESKKENAFSKFMAVLKARPSKKTRARYSFILAQLYEEKKENRKAIQFYKK